VACVACHVVSRSGKYMAAPTQASDSNGLWIYEVTKDAPPTPLVTEIPDTDGHGFATISPDDARVVAAWDGKMWMLDRATGTKQADLPLGEMEGTQPDWSPAGNELVFTAGKGDGPGEASLAKMLFTNGQWSAPTLFLSPSGDRTYNFPMYSHDAKWIAFNVGKGGHTDTEAQLMLVPAEGGTPIELIAASRVVSNEMTDGLHQNTAPTWAPEGDYHWIAFNSQREYGVVRPGGNNQIWVAAIDTSKAESGADPSFPAFRVPFQGLDEANHRAYWTLDIGEGTGGGGGGGPTPCDQIIGVGQACDPIADCCESGTYCDTADSGVTYVCTLDPVPK
jgi:Tol biopolymer transport system component